MLNVGPPKLLSKECNCQSHKLLSVEYCVSWKSDFHPVFSIVFRVLDPTDVLSLMRDLRRASYLGES